MIKDIANYKDKTLRASLSARGISKEEYLNGEKHGQWTHWRDNGKMHKEESYFKGKKDGSWTTFNENGIKEKTETK